MRLFNGSRLDRRRNHLRDALRETLVLVGLPRSYFTKVRNRQRRRDFEEAVSKLKPAMRDHAVRLWG